MLVEFELMVDRFDAAMRLGRRQDMAHGGDAGLEELRPADGACDGCPGPVSERSASAGAWVSARMLLACRRPGRMVPSGWCVGR